MTELFSSQAVAEACGISYRKLDYWVRQKYVRMDSPTPGSGTARRFTFPEALRVKVLATAVSAGLRNREVRVEELIASGQQQLDWSVFSMPVGEVAEQLRRDLGAQVAAE